jgi:hypothetical protein
MYCLQAAGDVSGGKATCEEGKSAAQQSETCMQNADNALQAARRFEAQAAEMSIHVKILQYSVKVQLLLVQCFHVSPTHSDCIHLRM